MPFPEVPFEDDELRELEMDMRSLVRRLYQMRLARVAAEGKPKASMRAYNLWKAADHLGTTVHYVVEAQKSVPSEDVRGTSLSGHVSIVKEPR